MYGDDGSSDLSADYIDGGDGDDFLVGLGGDDVMFGGDGADYVEGDDGADTMLGGKGVDYIYGNAGNDWIEGGDDGDVILGGSGADRIEGGPGNDYIAGQAGYDLLFGGDGNDTFEFQGHDIVAGIWSTVADIGTTPGNYDGVVVGSLGAVALFYQDGPNALIYSGPLGLVGGIIVLNITVADLQARTYFSM